MSWVLRRVVGLAKIRPRFFAKRNSERGAAIALLRCHPRRGDSGWPSEELVESAVVLMR